MISLKTLFSDTERLSVAMPVFPTHVLTRTDKIRLAHDVPELLRTGKVCDRLKETLYQRELTEPVMFHYVQEDVMCLLRTVFFVNKY